jgi:alkylation response protein AidB-like acyl-CoA dehydrogenase
MNLLPTAEQQQIIDTIRGFLGSVAPVERLRPDKFGQIGNPDAALWPQLAEMGFLGLGLAERHGGIGLTAIEEALVYREFGRHLVSVGILGITLGSHLAADAGIGGIDAMLAGTVPIGLANPRGIQSSGEFHLIEASNAGHVVAITADGLGLYDRSAFTSIEPRLGMDSHMILERGLLSGAAPLAFSAALRPRALLLLAAYAVGLAEASLAMAVAYALVREQFGKPIGSFQAIKHKCADMAMVAEAASAQVAFASVMVAKGGPDAVYHATAAKLMATDAALKNAAQNIQIHGAFGFTAEADAHLFLKRAHTVDFLAGDLRAQRAALIRQPALA